MFTFCSLGKCYTNGAVVKRSVNGYLLYQPMLGPSAFECIAPRISGTFGRSSAAESQLWVKIFVRQWTYIPNSLFGYQLLECAKLRPWRLFVIAADHKLLGKPSLSTTPSKLENLILEISREVDGHLAGGRKCC